MNWQKFETFLQKNLTSDSFDNDNRFTLKSSFAFCYVFFYKDQRSKDGNYFETDTVSSFQKTSETPELKRAKTYSALSFDRRKLFQHCEFVSTFSETLCYLLLGPFIREQIRRELDQLYEDVLYLLLLYSVYLNSLLKFKLIIRR